MTSEVPVLSDVSALPGNVVEKGGPNTSGILAAIELEYGTDDEVGYDILSQPAINILDQIC